MFWSVCGMREDEDDVSHYKAFLSIQYMLFFLLQMYRTVQNSTVYKCAENANINI